MAEVYSGYATADWVSVFPDARMRIRATSGSPDKRERIREALSEEILKAYPRAIAVLRTVIAALLIQP